MMRRSSLDALLRRKLKVLSSVQGRRTHRCTFLSVWQEIRRALEKGYTAKLIWEVLSESGVVHCKYPWFSRMIRQQIAKEAEPMLREQQGKRRQEWQAESTVTEEGCTRNSRQSVVVSQGRLTEEKKSQELSPNFGQARTDLTLDDFFGLTDTNVIEALQ